MTDVLNYENLEKLHHYLEVATQNSMEVETPVMDMTCWGVDLMQEVLESDNDRFDVMLDTEAGACIAGVAIALLAPGKELRRIVSLRDEGGEYGDVVREKARHLLGLDEVTADAVFEPLKDGDFSMALNLAFEVGYVYPEHCAHVVRQVIDGEDVDWEAMFDEKELLGDA